MSSTSFTGESGRNQYLQLFATQLQNQDPLDPTKQEDFLLQLAQFSMVEGVENTNTKLDQLIALQQASAPTESATIITNGDTAWLGKEVEYLDKDNRLQTGIVSKVERSGGQVLVKIGADLIPVADVNGVSAAAGNAAPMYAELSTATALLGKEVQTAKGYTGVVTSIQQKNGNVTVLAGNRHLALAEIQTVM